MELDDALRELRKLATKKPEAMAEKRGVPVNTVLGVSTAEVRQFCPNTEDDG